MSEKSSNGLLLRYAGLGIQLLIAIGIAVYGGLKLDQWAEFKTPFLVWILPLIVIAGVIYKIIKDTAPKTKK